MELDDLEELKSYSTPLSLYIYIYRENLNLFSDLKVIRVLKVRVLVQVSETKEQTLA